MESSSELKKNEFSCGLFSFHSWFLSTTIDPLSFTKHMFAQTRLACRWPVFILSEDTLKKRSFATNAYKSSVVYFGITQS